VSRWFQAFMGAAVTVVWLTRAFAAMGGAPQSPSGSAGWQIPETAPAEVSPLAGAAVGERGRALYKAKCQRCHGVDGSGGGPDADPGHPPGNLADGRAAARNPDGVVFYKVWNGRAKPKMPAMKLDLTREDVWTLVAYVKTLRK